ncbi:hypothetical protein PHLGIDRAFT_37424 [Phlebiopsis gigantea 11061_1 CR5-6]|uniref:Uncharacterized protein n=1 Tax=Phlebiopsis gigantea (strain 11061_1 CR5-6) TaxID=745531 RepID=A0A0C3NFH2_PHLG1|nr:hypothetical protein PHLGIDRAFT_37424 [Phlebiopsis gigantea 11061_1 CR5-6]
MSTDLVPYPTAWLSDPRALHEKLKTIRKAPLPPNPTLFTTVQVGKPCLVRGPPTPSGYDRWYNGTVRQVSMAFKFLDGSQSDRFVVEFTDPAHPELAPQTGVFFQRWHEVCGVGEEHFMPRITEETVANMLHTLPPLTRPQRVFYTPFIGQSFPPGPGGATWAGPIWTAGFIENHATVNSTTTVELKFSHFMGGLCAPAPMRFTYFRSLQWIRSWGVRAHHSTMDVALCGGRRVGGVDDAAVRGTVHVWRTEEIDEGHARLECECLETGTKSCGKV